MPGFTDDSLPTFKKGDAVSARKLTALTAAIGRQTLQPGQFQTGAFTVQRPLLSASGGGGLVLGQSTASVTSGTTTFSIDNIFSVEGADPRTDPESAVETLEVKNSLHLTLTDNHWVFAQKNKAGDWETWASAGTGGGGTTFDMVHFELAIGAELSYDTLNATATVLSSTAGTVGPITVTNTKGHVGLAGYRGYAYNDGTVYQILFMEGPARFADMIVADGGNPGDTTFQGTVQKYWGNPPNGVEISDEVLVHLLEGEQHRMVEGEWFRAIWNEKLTRWEVWWYSGLRITIRGTVGTVAYTDPSFTLSDVELVNGYRFPSGGSVTVNNDPPIEATNGTVVFARYDDSRFSGSIDDCWTTADAGNFEPLLRGIGDWDVTKDQQVDHAAGNTDAKWSEIQQMNLVTEITSLAISGGNLVLTYKKATALVKVVTAESTDTATIAVTECA